MNESPTSVVKLTFHLPMPTSTNRLHAHARGHRYRTKEYEAWRGQCDRYLLKWRSDRRLAGLDHRPLITGPFHCRIELAENGRGDGDNRIKAVLDWLQYAGIIENDRNCESGEWEWVPTTDAPEGCRVTLYAVPEE